MSTAQQVPDTYAVMREKEPLIWHEATKSYIISRYEDVARVFKDKQGRFTTDNYTWQPEPVHGRTMTRPTTPASTAGTRPSSPFLGNLSGDPEVRAAGERTRVEFAEYMIPVIP